MMRREQSSGRPSSRETLVGAAVLLVLASILVWVLARQSRFEVVGFGGSVVTTGDARKDSGSGSEGLGSFATETVEPLI